MFYPVRHILVCSGLLFLAGCESAGQAPRSNVATATPNIVLILADDLGYTDLGAFGGEISTPNLDALAQQGLRFTNFHTAASCAPTRAMLLTGTDNHLAGMGSQQNLATEQQSQHRNYSNRLLPEVPTFVEALKNQGYRTYMAGKWHLGYEAESLPNARGFEHSVALLEGGAGHLDQTPLFNRRPTASWIEDDVPITLPDDFYSSDYLVTKLLSYINDTQTDQPYFAYLAFTAPHWPLQAPSETVEKYRGKYDAGWDQLRAQRLQGAIDAGVIPQDSRAVEFEAGVRPWADLTVDEQAEAIARMEVYAAMIHRLDENVGRLVRALEVRGDLDNTVFVFISDNGVEAHNMELPSLHGDWLENNFDNSVANIGSATSYVTLKASWARAIAAPFRASKSKASEGGIRVPGFVVMPQGATGLDHSYMRVMDLGPTFLDMANTAALESAMGRSLLSRWTGGAPAYSDTDIIAYELYGRRGAQRGDWKILLQEPPYGTSQWQLYNLNDDPGEQQDLSAKHPKIKADLIDHWQRYAESVGVVLPEHPIRY